MTVVNEYEATARSRKAYRLSRICEHIMAQNPEITLEHFDAAEPALRARIAALAKVKVPSEQTWQMCCDMLRMGAHVPSRESSDG
mgnify:CR=1 FL=1